MACARRRCSDRFTDQSHMAARFVRNRPRDGFGLRRLGVERDAVPVCAPGTLSCPSAIGWNECGDEEDLTQELMNGVAAMELFCACHATQR